MLYSVLSITVRYTAQLKSTRCSARAADNVSPDGAKTAWPRWGYQQTTGQRFPDLSLAGGQHWPARVRHLLAAHAPFALPLLGWMLMPAVEERLFSCWKPDHKEEGCIYRREGKGSHCCLGDRIASIPSYFFTRTIRKIGRFSPGRLEE